MLTIYALAALPFFTGGLVITLAISRLSSRINAVYAADLIGAAAGCLLLIPLLDRLGAPGVVLTAAALAARRRRPVRARRAATRRARASRRRPDARAAGRASCRASPRSMSPTRRATRATAFSSASGIRFRAIGVYDRQHGDWSLSPTYTGPRAGYAIHGHRLGGVDADPARRAGSVERAVSALRTDGARLSPERERARLHRARDRARRRPRSRCRRSCSAPRAWMASRSTRSSPTT